MREILAAWFLIILAGSALAAPANPSATSITDNPTVRLTPEQARQALQVLDDPQRRAQIVDTLRAIAVAGALSAPPASVQAAASAPTAASGAATTARAALRSNGLASQMVRQGAQWAIQLSVSLHRSLAVLLDVSSVQVWWTDPMNNSLAHASLAAVAWMLFGALLPAVALALLAHRLLRRARAALTAPRETDPPESPPDEPKGLEPATATVSLAPATVASKTDAANGQRHAARHWQLLRRLPRALLNLLVKLLPLIVFVLAAIALMSILTEEGGKPQDRALDSLIDIYVLSRVISIVSSFLLEPDAPHLRLIRMGDTWAAFTQRWVVLIVSVVGTGLAAIEIAVSLGLSEAARVALMKVVALVGHTMLSIMILRCRRPVAARIRAGWAASPSLAMVGNALADSWAGIAVLLVMASWFVWALDVRNGYYVLLHLGGLSIAILVGARIASIVLFGALGRLFHEQEDGAKNSLVQQHAYRYYPLLRRLISSVVAIVTALLLLQVWGADVFVLFDSNTIGHRLATALVTIAIATAIALFVWEAVNVSVERRLEQWTTAGDLARAARLRTLLPMLRSTLFVLIAAVVALTGLSELGVNTAPMLAGASIFGVALGFGSQKLVQDFITGLFLLMENAMQVGDWVTLAGVSGTVEYLSMRTVRLRGGDGSLYTVPFSSVSTVNNTNRGLGNAAVKVSIAYGQDIDLAIATLKEIGAALREDKEFKDGILSDFEFWGVDQLDGAAVTLSGQIGCLDSARWGVQREFNRRILDLFRARGIEIANPQRNVLVRGTDAP